MSVAAPLVVINGIESKPGEIFLYTQLDSDKKPLRDPAGLPVRIVDFAQESAVVVVVEEEDGYRRSAVIRFLTRPSIELVWKATKMRPVFCLIFKTAAAPDVQQLWYEDVNIQTYLPSLEDLRFRALVGTFREKEYAGGREGPCTAVIIMGKSVSGSPGVIDQGYRMGTRTGAMPDPTCKITPAAFVAAVQKAGFKKLHSLTLMVSGSGGDPFHAAWKNALEEADITTELRTIPPKSGELPAVFKYSSTNCREWASNVDLVVGRSAAAGGGGGGGAGKLARMLVAPTAGAGAAPGVRGSASGAANPAVLPVAPTLDGTKPGVPPMVPGGAITPSVAAAGGAAPVPAAGAVKPAPAAATVAAAAAGAAAKQGVPAAAAATGAAVKPAVPVPVAAGGGAAADPQLESSDEAERVADGVIFDHTRNSLASAVSLLRFVADGRTEGDTAEQSQKIFLALVIYYCTFSARDKASLGAVIATAEMGKKFGAFYSSLVPEPWTTTTTTPAWVWVPLQKNAREGRAPLEIQWDSPDVAYWVMNQDGTWVERSASRASRTDSKILINLDGSMPPYICLATALPEAEEKHWEKVCPVRCRHTLPMTHAVRAGVVDKAHCRRDMLRLQRAHSVRLYRIRNYVGDRCYSRRGTSSCN